MFSFIRSSCVFTICICSIFALSPSYIQVIHVIYAIYVCGSDVPLLSPIVEEIPIIVFFLSGAENSYFSNSISVMPHLIWKKHRSHLLQWKERFALKQVTLQNNLNRNYNERLSTFTLKKTFSRYYRKSYFSAQYLIRTRYCNKERHTYTHKHRYTEPNIQLLCTMLRSRLNRKWNSILPFTYNQNIDIHFAF